MPTDKQFQRTPDGKLSSFAWPGGYPLLYVNKDNEVFCPDCANEIEKSGEDWEKPTYCFAHFEGKPIVCEECGAGTESSYGDPDED